MTGIECSFRAPLSGSYYGKLMAQVESTHRIREVPWDPALPVTTAWDLGIGNSTAIWFCQQLGAEVRLIDYLECSGVGLDYYAKALRERPYVYGEHLLPHDVQVNEMGTGKSRLEVLAALGIRARVLPQLKVDDGIQAVRALLPRCWFDGEKCARGWRRCATTGAPSTSISAISGRRPCMTGAAMAPTPSATWRSA